MYGVHSGHRRALAEVLAAAGLDIFTAVDFARYRRAVADIAALPQLDAFGRDRPEAYLVANTRALWPLFLSAYAHDPSLQASPDPLDTYVAGILQRVLVDTSPRHRVWTAAERDDKGDVRVSMLRVAEAAHFAQIGPAHMAIHPEMGPWFGLRALIVFDAEAEAELPPMARPCEGCSAPCAAALEAALATLPAEHLRRSHGDADWRAWLAVRESCPVGRSFSYTDDQAEYHYTKRRHLLEHRPV